jgi:hypothetical protein
MNIGAESTAPQVPFCPDTLQDVRAHVSSKTNIVFEENGIGTLLLLQRQGHVWGKRHAGEAKDSGTECFLHILWCNP